MTQAEAPRHHDLSVFPDTYEALVDGRLGHDLRRVRDAPFRAGDTLAYREVDPVTDAPTGRGATARVTYVTSVENQCALSPMGLHPDYAILSVADVVPASAT